MIDLYAKELTRTEMCERDVAMIMAGEPYPTKAFDVGEALYHCRAFKQHNTDSNLVVRLANSYLELLEYARKLEQPLAGYFHY